MNQLEKASRRVTGDFRNMIADGEDLLKATASATGDGFTAARAKFEDRVQSAKASLADATQPLVDMTRNTANAADDYVHANPWTVIGVATLVGLVVGFLSSKRNND